MSLNRNSGRRSGPTLPTYYSQQNSSSSKDAASVARAKARAGPNRSTKASGKLKILPEEPEDGVVNEDAASVNLGGVGDEEDSSEDEESGSGDVEQKSGAFKQLELAKIPEGSMRRDAKRITRRGRASLPRVTAYSTATSYRMRELTKWLQARSETHRTNVMTFDECVYTTYSYDLLDQARQDHHTHSSAVSHHSITSSSLKHRNGSSKENTSSSHRGARTGDLLGIPELQGEQEGDEESKKDGGENGDSNGSSANGASTATLVDGVGEDASKEEQDRVEAERLQDEVTKREEARQRRRERFAIHGLIPEVFFMEYGAVVIWGMTLAEEKKLLKELRKFEVEKLHRRMWKVRI
jgi:uncharacterized Rmd1/YagE family protein